MASAASFDAYLEQAPGEVAQRFYSLWMDQRHVLEEAGYNGESWKRAAHVVWWSQPKKLRFPDTEKELADVLGVSVRTLRNWRYASPDQYQRGAEAVHKLIYEWLPDVAYAAYDNAVNGGEKGAADRRLLFAAGGIATAQADITSGGAPLKTYSVLAHPDMWDEDNDRGHLDAPTVADRPVEG